MKKRRATYLALMGASLVALMGASLTTLEAQPAAAPAAVKVDADDIGGTVMGAKGPEAGVWVIAETRELPTRYIKIVATDDQGRFVIPDLPKANYTVWVRGYGLVDSPKSKAVPGQTLALKSVAAANAAAAAQYYPAMYWYSMLNIPDKNLFPGTGTEAGGNGMPKTLVSQGLWLRYMKTDGCVSCHQLGDKATRTFPVSFGKFESSGEAWERRIQSGQAGGNMVDAIGRVDTQRAFKLFGEWTDRIAKGELPKSMPSRPTGMERNVVVTLWDWSTPSTYLHDEVASDRRNPTVNANGIIYGSPEESSDFIPWLDPVRNTKGLIKTEWRDPNTPTTANNPIYQPSPYWGTEKVWDSHTVVHNPMLDEKGRVWLTARIRAPANPAFCKEGSDHPSAKLFPVARSGRQAEMYDPATKKFTLFDLCFNTHHLQFDKNNVLWFSAGGPQNEVLGWLDVKKYEQTHDVVKSQGWTPFILDTNGNGKVDAGWNEPNKPADPKKDTRIITGFYGIAPNPADGTVWGSVEGFPGGIARFDPKTGLTEWYEVPWDEPKAKVNGFSPRGGDIDSKGIFWTVLASGHLASFDRAKCKAPLNGPNATGKHCPEGWTLYDMPGPHFQNVADRPGSIAEAPYYDWVDQHNTLGLGANVPIATGNLSDSLAALVNGKFMVMRVPYPMGFFAKGLDGRIDDPNAGWKGRGVWSTYSDRSTAHIEGGKGETSKVVKFQVRPDPLAH